MQNDPLSHWSLDRETVLAKVIDAPIERVFEAWVDAGQLPRWFGPDGYSIENLQGNICEGGVSTFEMVAPNGHRYPNHKSYLRISAPRLIAFDHGAREDDPHRFRVTITFDRQSDGKSVITLRQLHPSREQRDATVDFGAVELGYQTLDKLARHVAR